MHLMPISEGRHLVESPSGRLDDRDCIVEILEHVSGGQRRGIEVGVLLAVALAAHAVEGPQDRPERRVELRSRCPVHREMAAAGGGAKSLIFQDRGERLAGSVVGQRVGALGIADGDVASSD
jgi:hypothetical protein